MRTIETKLFTYSELSESAKSNARDWYRDSSAGMNTSEILRHYIVCALWSSTDNADDNGGEPLDANYTEDDIHPDTVADMRADIEAFTQSAQALLVRAGLSDSQIGHDFWLTRNGHGAGFWDRGLGEVGDLLTDMCKPFGSVDLYVGDDGLIYS